MGKHPLIDEVARCLRRRADGVVVLAAAELEAVQRKALRIDSGPELLGLARELMRTAAMLAKTGASGAAEALFAMTEPLLARLDERARADARTETEQAEAARRVAQERQRAKKESHGGLRPSPKVGVSLRRRRPAGG